MRKHCAKARSHCEENRTAWKRVCCRARITQARFQIALTSIRSNKAAKNFIASRTTLTMVHRADAELLTAATTPRRFYRLATAFYRRNKKKQIMANTTPASRHHRRYKRDGLHRLAASDKVDTKTSRHFPPPGKSQS